LQLRDCLTALEQMRTELQERVQSALSGAEERDIQLAGWKQWSRDWRKRFEKLGFSCRLTEYSYDKNPALGYMAEIYSLIDYFQRRHTRMVRRFITENARPLKKMRELLARVREKILQIESLPVDEPL
jgi:hypothetical protein